MHDSTDVRLMRIPLCGICAVLSCVWAIQFEQLVLLMHFHLRQEARDSTVALCVENHTMNEFFNICAPNRRRLTIAVQASNVAHVSNALEAKIRKNKIWFDVFFFFFRCYEFISITDGTKTANHSAHTCQRRIRTKSKIKSIKLFYLYSWETPQ